jgi:cell division protein FtsB
VRVLRIVVLLLVALLAWLQYRLWFGHGGAGETQALQTKVEQQRRDNGGLQQRNDALAAEVKDLKSADGGAAVEERARSELGMIKPGETFYRVVEHRPEAPADADAAPAPDDGAPHE